MAIKLGQTSKISVSNIYLYVCSLNPEESPNPRKTPIQILHEYGIKRGVLPVYEMEKAEGEAHHPSFVFSVKIGEITCTGKGQSPSVITCWISWSRHALCCRRGDFFQVRVTAKRPRNIWLQQPL